jgi:hypothetical protein
VEGIDIEKKTVAFYNTEFMTALKHPSKSNICRHAGDILSGAPQLNMGRLLSLAGKY